MNPDDWPRNPHAHAWRVTSLTDFTGRYERRSACDCGAKKYEPAKDHAHEWLPKRLRDSCHEAHREWYCSCGAIYEEDIQRSPSDADWERWADPHACDECASRAGAPPPTPNFAPPAYHEPEPDHLTNLDADA